MKYTWEACANHAITGSVVHGVIDGVTKSLSRILSLLQQREDAWELPEAVSGTGERTRSDRLTEKREGS